MRRPQTVPLAIVVVIAASLLGTGCGLFSEDGEPPPTSLPRPPEADIVYGSANTCSPGQDPCTGPQSVDIYRSDEPGPNPVAVWIHGGGFVSGDKSLGISEHLQPLLDDGWDIVSANYRLSIKGENRFPAAVQDAKQVVRWVKANAVAQDWDPTSVAAIGHSAGGNIVAMLATTSGVAALEAPDLSPELAAVDSSIIAAIAIAPVTDMAMFRALPEWQGAVRDYLGCTDCSAETLAEASAQTYVTADAAPILLVDGVMDPIAPPAQGQILIDAYEAAGIGDRIEMIVVDDGPEEHQGHNPDLERYSDQFVDFLDAARPDSD